MDSNYAWKLDPLTQTVGPWKSPTIQQSKWGLYNVIFQPVVAGSMDVQANSMLILTLNEGNAGNGLHNPIHNYQASHSPIHQ